MSSLYHLVVCSCSFSSGLSRYFAAQSKLPLGLVIQAMALDIDQKDGGLEVVNFGAMVRAAEFVEAKTPARLSVARAGETFFCACVALH